MEVCFFYTCITKFDAFCFLTKKSILIFMVCSNSGDTSVLISNRHINCLNYCLHRCFLSCCLKGFLFGLDVSIVIRVFCLYPICTKVYIHKTWYPYSCSRHISNLIVLTFQKYRVTISTRSRHIIDTNIT